MAKMTAIAQIAQQHDSFYLYEESVIQKQIAQLRSNFPSVQFLYSVKCNHQPQILQTVFQAGLGADAASVGEVELAQKYGCQTQDIYYSAPGKTLQDLQNALGKAVLIVDSLGELERLEKLPETADAIKVGMRINPNFTFTENRGSASKFGIDEAQALAYLKQAQASKIHVNGIHVHLKSQELDAAKLLQYYKKLLQLAVRIERVLGYQLDYLNFGSGMGIAYAAKDKEIDMAALGANLEQELSNFKAEHPRTKLLIEVGRYVVGQSGTYVTKVLDKKLSYGVTYVILKNTLNGFLRPSLARLVVKYAGYPEPAGAEPLFTGYDAFAFTTNSKETEKERVTLMGNLCTATDVIAENIILPKLKVGDLVMLSNAGSYAEVLSPKQFSSQVPPEEFFLSVQGEILA